MSRHIDKLITLYEKESLKTLTLRETVRKLRQEKALKERQVQLANRTIERLAVDRGTAEAQDAAKDACIRRLQTQVAVLGKKGDLNETAEEMSCELAERVVRLEMQMAACKAERDDFEKRTRDLEEENKKLKRAVQVASEVKLAAKGVVEEREALHKANNDRLLLAVAKAQEEAVGLAKELATSKNETETMETALKKARDHLQKQHEALQRWKEYESSHAKKERSLIEEVEGLKSVVCGVETERKERRALEEKVREMVGQLEVERTRRMEAEAHIKVMMEDAREQELVRADIIAETRSNVEAEVGVPFKDGREDGHVDNVLSNGHGTGKPEARQINAVDVQATLGRRPEAASHVEPVKEPSRLPTLFEIANMDIVS